MGYRSDVRICTTNEGFKKLSIYSKEHSPEYDLMKNYDYHRRDTEGNHEFGWDDIKWYEHCDFEDVDAIMNGLKELEKEEIPYTYHRIGESADDVEEIYMDKDYVLPELYVSRVFTGGIKQVTKPGDRIRVLKSDWYKPQLLWTNQNGEAVPVFPNGVDQAVKDLEGLIGTVENIDGAGQIWVNFDNGRHASVVPEADEFEILEISEED